MVTKRSTGAGAASTTPLHRELAERIIRVIHDDALAPGDRLVESRLSVQLGVSRTPIRAALEHLAGRGYVRREPRRGVALLRRPPPPRGASEESEGADDALMVRVARDRQQGRLPTDVSERDLMQAYGLNRVGVKHALERLSDLGIVERRLGYGWRFLDDAWNDAVRAESYRFRMLLEPQAILEPGFALPASWLDEMRARHESFLRRPWTEAASIAFFEMNAAFHEGIAAGAGNRFLLAAIQRQNRVRRLSNYNWKHGQARVHVNSREHLEILERLAAGDRDVAAALLRRHLEQASRLKAPPAPAP